MIRIMKYGEISDAEIFSRTVPGNMVAPAVTEIIEAVKADGDRALLSYTERFDGVKLDAIEVTETEFDEALRAVGGDFLAVLNRSADNIRKFHSMQIRSGFSYSEENGVMKGQKVTPIEKVGIYVPGGTAPLSSTVLMDTIPAKIAGCGQIVMASPPGKDGKIHPAVLAAAKIAGVDRVFKMGGAQAIAALAYGTESVPKVDKITGPGNVYVAEAKKQVFGLVSIDMIAGPSEILVLADDSARADYVAADMLSQAEHDRLATAVLVTDSQTLAEETAKELERQLSELPRESIARESIDTYGKIIIVSDMDEAVNMANAIAPEHLEIYTKDPFSYLDKIKNAGSVFLGENCPEAVGDYIAGPNHTLPTSGTARFSSPLSVDDFIKKTQYIYYTKEALSGDWEDIVYFADTEGLDAHGESAAVRFKEEKK